MEKERQPNYEIREASHDDIFKIRQMHAKSWLAAYPNDEAGVPESWIKETTNEWLTPESLEKSREHFAGILDNPDHFYRIATAGDQVVGMVHASKIEGKQHLDALYVDESQYGSGLAQQLIGMVDQWIDPAQPIDLEVVAYNKRAIRFYEKCGFSLVEGSEHLFKDKMPTVGMIRKGRES